MNPKREGKIREYHNGYYSMYIIEWIKQDGFYSETHIEVEVYKGNRENCGILIWNTTDPDKLGQAMKVFLNSPEAFADVLTPGDLPVDRTDLSQVMANEKGGPVEMVKDNNGNPPQSLRMFPVHSYKQWIKDGWKDCPEMVPWDMLKPYETKAVDNHSQDLETLARRGGLCPREMYAIMNNKDWGHEMFKMLLSEAIVFLNKRVKEFMEERGLS